MLEEATSFSLRFDEGPASAAADSAGPEFGSGTEAWSLDSTRRSVGAGVFTSSELVPSPYSTESTPVTLLEVLKDL